MPLSAASDLRVIYSGVERKFSAKQPGGLIKQLLTAKTGRSISQSRSRNAAKKKMPREYIGAIIRNRDPPKGELALRDPRL